MKRYDTNGDGQLDDTEREAMRDAFRSMREAGGGGGLGQGGPGGRGQSGGGAGGRQNRSRE